MTASTMQHHTLSWLRIAIAVTGLAALLTGCAPQKVVLETTDGIEVTLREERNPPRPAPGPEFSELLELRVTRSLARVAVIYQDVIVFNDSDPVHLFSDAQRKVIGAVLTRELPTLPPDKRLGFKFLDVYLRNEMDVEIYPEGNYLVYDFRSLMRRRVMTRSIPAINLGELFVQRDQIAEEGNYPLLKDPIASTARPDLQPPDSEGERQPESPL